MITRSLLAMAVLFAAGLGPVSASGAAAVTRETVFEFAEMPQVKKDAGKWIVTFATKSACDVTVAVEDSAGRIVNFIGSGVLGSNAPEPFVKGSLRQTLVWDMKDMTGRPMPDAGNCRVRVSLGLTPVFNRMVLEHKKDMLNTHAIEGIAADSAGVYVLSYGMGTAELKMYDHKGNYVRTLIPFSSKALDTSALNVSKAQIHGQAGDWAVPGPAFNTGLAMPFWGARYEFFSSPSKLSAAGGWIFWLSDLGEMLRIRSDGTTGGLPFPGQRVPLPPFVTGKEASGRFWRSVLSNDGRYAYLIGTQRDILLTSQALEYAVNKDSLGDRSVWRVRVDASDFGVPTNVLAKSAADWSKTAMAPFIANPTEPADPLRCLTSAPRGIACDGQGRVYVCDSTSIKVFSPEGGHVKTIPNSDTLPPIQIDVNRKTGEIYLLLSEKLSISGYTQKPQTIVLKKIKSLDDPAVVYRREFTTGHSSGYCPMFCVDYWETPAKIWTAFTKSGIRIYRDTGSELALVDDFAEDIRNEAHVEPGVLPEWHNSSSILCDPLRGHLYMTGIGANYRFDISDSAVQCHKIVYSGGSAPGAQESGVQWGVANGILHYLGPGERGKTVIRWNPDKFTIGTLTGTMPTLTAPVAARVPLPAMPFTLVSMANPFTVLPDGAMVGHKNGSLVVADSTGAVVDTILNWRPDFIQVDARTNLYVCTEASFRGSWTSPNKHQVLKYGHRAAKSDPLWAYDGFWKNGDMICGCANGNFFTDPYGRSFIPKQFDRTIGIIDANGNRICEAGRYGNSDDTTEDGLAIALSSSVAVDPDKWLYVMDQGNARIVQAKLGYAKTVIIGNSTVSK